MTKDRERKLRFAQMLRLVCQVRRCTKGEDEAWVDWIKRANECVEVNMRQYSIEPQFVGRNGGGLDTWLGLPTHDGPRRRWYGSHMREAGMLEGLV